MLEIIEDECNVACDRARISDRTPPRMQGCKRRWMSCAPRAGTPSEFARHCAVCGRLRSSHRSRSPVWQERVPMNDVRCTRYSPEPELQSLRTCFYFLSSSCCWPSWAVATDIRGMATAAGRLPRAETPAEIPATTPAKTPSKQGPKQRPKQRPKQGWKQRAEPSPVLYEESPTMLLQVPGASSARVASTTLVRMRSVRGGGRFPRLMMR